VVFAELYLSSWSSLPDAAFRVIPDNKRKAKEELQR
jgi:hypothetical protein